MVDRDTKGWNTTSSIFLPSRSVRRSARNQSQRQVARRATLPYLITPDHGTGKGDLSGFIRLTAARQGPGLSPRCLWSLARGDCFYRWLRYLTSKTCDYWSTGKQIRLPWAPSHTRLIWTAWAFSTFWGARAARSEVCVCVFLSFVNWVAGVRDWGMRIWGFNWSTQYRNTSYNSI